MGRPPEKHRLPFFGRRKKKDNPWLGSAPGLKSALLQLGKPVAKQPWAPRRSAMPFLRPDTALASFSEALPGTSAAEDSEKGKILFQSRAAAWKTVRPWKESRRLQQADKMRSRLNWLITGKFKTGLHLDSTPGLH